MNYAENTTQLGCDNLSRPSVRYDNLAGLRLNEVGRVLDVVARLGTDGQWENMLPKLVAVGPVGLIGADAVTQALRRLGPWGAIDRVEAFLARFQRDELDTELVRWTRDAINRLRTGEIAIWGADGEMDEARRLAFEEAEWHPRGRSAETWLEHSALQLVELAVWLSEQSSDEVGLTVCDELIAAGREQEAHDFVQHMRGFDASEAATLARNLARDAGFFVVPVEGA